MGEIRSAETPLFPRRQPSDGELGDEGREAMFLVAAMLQSISNGLSLLLSWAWGGRVLVQISQACLSSTTLPRLPLVEVSSVPICP